MKPIVYLVDDDAALRDATTLFLKLHGLDTVAFASAEALLAELAPGASGCLLLDLRLDGMDGLAVQRELVRRGQTLPIIVVTAHGEVTTTRAALKAGAFDFLEKPVDNALLLDVIRNALAQDGARRGSGAQVDERRLRLERLTPRERQVFDLVAVGRTHREIASLLGISARTVEVYKSRMMEKLQARTLADVVRLAADVASGAGAPPAASAS